MKASLIHSGNHSCFAAQLVFCLVVFCLVLGATLDSLRAASFETLYNFHAPWGASALAQAKDNAFYGVTARGGEYGCGSVYRVSASGEITILASFANTNGADPEAGMTLGDDGSFLGTTAGGGSYAKGTVFRVTTNGILTSLLSFSGQNGPNLGERPGTLSRGPDGAFYGTTYLGGNSQNGTVFRVTTNGVLTTLLSFPGGSNGLFPAGGVTLGNDGAFYGVCASGGLYGHGTVYRLTTDGLLTTLYSFANSNDGSQPSARLLLGCDGTLYGTTYFGGAGRGTVFRVTTNGVLTTLAMFVGGGDGDKPLSRLVQGVDGALYGTTVYGGDSGYGVVSQGTLFRVTTNGVLTTLVSFVGTNGTTPVADLMQSRDGNIFGTTTGGGTGGAGTIFRLDTNRVFSMFVSFIIPQGMSPQTEFVQRSDGDFYGTTDSGGDNGLGTVFCLSQKSNLITLVTFNGTNGAHPRGPLVQGTDGHFYGTTIFGGSSDCGTVFRLTTNGTFTMLASFAITNGARPAGMLCQDDDGALYGTTVVGGAYSKGTVFRITTSGVLTSVVSFDGTNGANPQAGVIKGNDGAFYGTTAIGGTNDNSGTVFRVAANGVLQTIHSFRGFRYEGSFPRGPLIQGEDGAFYGTTRSTSSGNGGYGTVFRITPEGSFTNIAWFDDYYPSGGRLPVGTLVIGSDQAFYGVTTSGGSSNSSGLGTVFRVTPNGVLTTVISFNATNGSSPLAGLMRASDCSFYGATASGGIFGGGTLFRLDPSSRMESLTSTGGGWNVRFSGLPAVTYRLQRASDLLGPWGDVGSITPGSDFLGHCVDINLPANRAFYRVAYP